MDEVQVRKQAEALVAQMTVEEAASQLKYDAPAIERLGIPRLQLVERSAARGCPGRYGHRIPPGHFHGRHV